MEDVAYEAAPHRLLVHWKDGKLTTPECAFGLYEAATESADDLCQLPDVVRVYVMNVQSVRQLGQPPIVIPPPWIPVTERLPEPGVQVLAWDREDRECVVIEMESHHDTQLQWFRTYYSHWTPLPEPPKE